MAGVALLAVVVDEDLPDEPDDDEPEDEDRPDEPPLSAIAGALARANIRVAAERTRVVRMVFMVYFLCIDG